MKITHMSKGTSKQTPYLSFINQFTIICPQLKNCLAIITSHKCNNNHQHCTDSDHKCCNWVSFNKCRNIFRYSEQHSTPFLNILILMTKNIYIKFQHDIFRIKRQSKDVIYSQQQNKKGCKGAK